ncbi:MAG: DUF342 domain-containing protein [Planctomycetes bacterium]|nr:DUF342 domain-containing protein [Planctomycetota bacterium]
MSSSSEGNLEIEVRIEGDGAVAKVLIPRDFPKQTLDASQLAAVVRQRGVSIDATVEARLQQIIQAFRDESDQLEHVIAESIPAVNGQDGRLEWVEGFDPATESRAENTPDDSDAISYYNRVVYIRVTEGSHVATLHEPTEGEDGRDVTGRTIKARPGKRCDVRIDPSVTVEANGRIIAQLDGVLQCEGGLLKLSRLFEVNGYVDFSTGNIDFDGTVNVQQGVRDRFEVKATEDIIVGGLIEAATIRSGRHFDCRQGMAAKDRGQLLVGGDANAGYLNGVRGHIKGNLTIRRELINCELVIGGDLICEQGAIIGGSIAVAGSIRAGVLGSPAGTPSVIVLGTGPLLSDHIRKLKGLAKQLKEQLRAQKSKYDALSAAGKSLRPSEKERLTELSFEISETEQKLDACEAEHAQITQTIDRESGSGAVDIRVSKVIHSRVCLRMNNHEVTFDAPLKGPVTIGSDEQDQPQFRQGDGPIQPLTEVAKIRNRAA